MFVLFSIFQSTSQHVPYTVERQHVECQTDPPHATSVGTQYDQSKKQKSVSTQLSFGKLRDWHMRSKGSQAAVLCHSVSTETTSAYADFPFGLQSPISSTPMKTSAFNPKKRRRIELEEEDTESETLCEPHDTTYNPEDTVVTEESELSFVQSSSYNEKKYVVFESCLRDLFDICPLCRRKCDVRQRQQGTFVAFSQLCSNCSYNKQWNSQPIVGSTPTGNLLLSAATYFTGNSFIQIEKVFRAMNLQVFQYDTFRRHAGNLLEPAIVHKWKTDQANMLLELQKNNKIAIAGDMRADSPGHSAKYGSYTLLDLNTNTIIDLQLVQSNEVGGSYHMEKEGLKRSLDLLDSNGLTVDYIVTDRHPQIQKFLRERSITQYYDVWHFEKGLSKRLALLAEQKGCEVLKKWLRSIRNHVYWCATSSTSGPEKVAKWNSLINHLQNVHVHDDPTFSKCEHPDQESTNSTKWLTPGSMVLHKVEKILVNKRVLRDVGKLSHHHQTSSVEAFHSLILRFAPKNVVFPFIGMLCRLYLATMHYNENADREQAVTKAGEAKFKVVFPKSKRGECVARPVKTQATYFYVDDLIRLVFDEVLEDPAPFVEKLKEIPIPLDLASQFERPSKEDVIARHLTRFSLGVVGSRHTDHPDRETPSGS
nr:uncharacterized protein LOC129445807 [Misgurnus anguillicaudatus]